MNAYEVYPELFLLPFDFFWLHFPIFYIYTQQVCIFAEEKPKYWVLYPGIIAFIGQTIVFFLPYATKTAITDSIGYDLYTYIKILYGLSIGIYTLQLVSRHKIEVHNYFSMVESKELNWMRIFLIYNITGSILYTLFYHTIAGSLFAKIFFASFDLILIYWVSFHAVQQRNILSLLAKKESTEFDSEKFSISADLPSLPVDSLEEKMERIDAYMKDSESFTNTDLTIVDISGVLGMHPKRISTAINSVGDKNFNAFVNQFRISKAKKLLEDPEYDHLSIEGIGREVGFHSKSAFYSAFKKFTGTTPSKYKESVMVR